MKKLISWTSLALTASFLFTPSCTTPGKRTAIGAGAGAATGAILGAVIGHQSGNKGKGAAWGAAIGGALGGTIGNRLDKQAKELAQIAETKRTEHGIITRLKGDILFPVGSANLQGDSSQRIAKIAAIIKKYPEDRVTVIGHTDSTGSSSRNLDLSESRARSVMTKIINGGVPASYVTMVGKGQNEPISDNKTAEGRRQNRRVEIHISVDPEALKKAG